MELDMQVSKMLATFGALIAITSSTLDAQVQQVTDRSQIGGASTLSWQGHPANNPFTMETGIGTITMTVTGNGLADTDPWYSPCQVGSCWDGGFTQEEWLLFGYGAVSYDLEFSEAIEGFATQAWFNHWGTDGQIRITAFDGSTQVGQYTITTGGGGAANDNQAAVVGIGGVAFNKVHILSMPGQGQASEFAMNQVTLGTSTVVPEPSTYALMAVGLGAMAVLARRRDGRSAQR
ncbi:MAG: PEP-CTERM sorting domain-containing protein [Gemmatimonadaceae bacterium]|nr:PEP-CTERM sorting domain-containing protein [Gemmatimonadaceae bacterium]